MTNEERLAKAQLDKMNRKTKKSRLSVTIFSLTIPMVIFAMDPAVSVVGLVAPYWAWKHYSKRLV